MNYDLVIAGLVIYAVFQSIVLIYHFSTLYDKINKIVNSAIAAKEQLNNEQIKHYVDIVFNQYQKNVGTWVNRLNSSINNTNESIKGANTSIERCKAEINAVNGRLFELNEYHESVSNKIDDIVKELNDNIDAQNEINVKATETFSIIQTTLQALQLHNEQQDQLLADFVNKRIFNKESEKSEYVPYGPEWQKEMMKWTKKELVEYMGKFFKERSATK